jgi:tight adherence protein C
MYNAADIAILGLGAVLSAAWLSLFVLGLRRAELFRPLNAKQFPLRGIYIVGYAAMGVIRYGYKSKGDRKLRRCIEALYGERYAEYYLRVIYSQRVTAALTVAILSCALYGFTGDYAAAAAVMCLAGLSWSYFGVSADRKLKKRSAAMLRDFTEAVTKLALLTNSGMILRESWESVADTGGDSELYAEMRTAVSEMKNGTPETDALFNFGSRCLIPEIRKFASTVAQGLTKGNSELAYMLKEQSREVWSAKKHSVKRQGEKAAGKLLIPISIMFIGILIMVIVPIFSGIG